MTISYSGNFARLLLRWKGSLWKTVWKELLVYLIAYYVIRVIYQFALNANQKEVFEKVSLTFEMYTAGLPLTFLLGFYINAIVKRWWDQFQWIAWPDDLLSLACVLIPDGDDADASLKRHTIARHTNLTAALAWRDISKNIRKRFPTLGHLVQAGLMTPKELQLYEAIKAENVKWFLPLQWTQTLVQDHATKYGCPPPLLATFYKELYAYRCSFRKLYCYDWVCTPLVYTQVTALATYAYFLFCLLGRQFLDTAKGYHNNLVDFYVPVFTIVQFLFFIGWFKVGEDLMRPFGSDDDDLELNYILDRHVQASFTLVNHVCTQRPPLEHDRFSKDPDNLSLPHTTISEKMKDRPPKLHAVLSGKVMESAIDIACTRSKTIDPVVIGAHEIDTKKRCRQF